MLKKPLYALAAAAAVAALTLAACGDDEGDASASASSQDPVSTESIDGTDVLADANGRALYTSDQEGGGIVVCTAGCTAIWDPLLVSELDADARDLSGDFGETTRPDGGRQVTFGGSPLYTFTEEGPGELTGDGLSDSFDGTRFTWSVATVDGGGDVDDSDSSPDAGGAYGY
ncbi:MAG TPA: hypothetical protein VHJ54_03045 [Solirubrobacterales bacterium]|jgi:predicted lipoprotein with Yx(FWY)xxD motif|nr:hypothetical protein [Solirubrobacterales bacterium]